MRIVAIAVVALAALVGLAFLLSGDTDRTLGVAQPQVDGQALPPPAQGTSDPAIGQPAPAASGENPEGEPVAVGAGVGHPQALAFMAHWCPHCQEEVPEVAEWVARGALPADVELVAVSTRHDPARPNWPPDEWFEREGWPGEVLVDSTDAVADAYSLAGTPYWVFVDSDGAVVGRASGRISEDVFRTVLASMSRE